jgi:tetratricopeptide (TPR) repeat protein
MTVRATTSNPQVRFGPLCIGVLALLGAMTIPGCTTSAPITTQLSQTQRPSDVLDAHAMAPLHRAASARTPRPQRLPPPQQVRAEGVMPLAPGDIDERARLGVDEAIATLGAWAASKPDRIEGGVSTEDRVQAIKQYAAGRAMIIDGDATGAEQALEEATWHDPDAGPAWIALGQARIALGKRTEALQAIEQAIEVGERDATALDALGRAAMETGEAERAAGYFAGALFDADAIADPGLRNVLYVDFAGALEATGRLTPACESLERGLALPVPGSIVTSQGSDLESIRRRSPSLWTEVGDLSIKVGRFDKAFAAYDRAADLLESTSTRLAARRVYAGILTGRDGLGALALVDHVVERHGVATPADRSLVRYVADHTRLGPALADALGGARARFGASSRTIDIELAIAQSEAMSARNARSLLHDAADRDGVTGPLISQLLRTHAETDSSLVDEALWLLRRAPLEGDEIVVRLFRRGPDVEGVERAMAASRADWAGVLRAWYRLERFDGDAALQELDALAPSVADEPGVLALGVRVGEQMGRWDVVDDRLRRLSSISGVEADRARVRAFSAIQRYTDAFAIASKLADLEGASALDLLNAARLAIGRGDDTDATRWLRRLLEQDPHDETAREQLITLATSGARQDMATATTEARAIRDLRPEGRLVRWLLVTETMRRGFLDRAESMLLALLEEEPGDVSAFEFLVQVWSARARQGGGIDDALAWLDAEIERRPLDVWLEAGRARLLSEAGNPEEALQRLEAVYELIPSPQVARVIESILRDPLDRVAEADDRQAARLQDEHQSIDGMVERAILLIDNGRFDEAVVYMRDALPDRVELDRAQSSRLGDAVERAVKNASNAERLVILASMGRFGSRVSPELGLRWLQTIIEYGSTRDAIALVESIDSATASVLLPALNQILRVADEEVDHPRARIAYRLAGRFLGRDDEEAFDLYRLALRLYPDFAVAANDLGYFLLERGGDLDEVERLLDIAIENDPENASILDSYGWLRYHQGRLDDETGPDGRVIHGACSLLERALERAIATRDEVINTLEIRDHLGDAVWLDGRHDEGVRIWSDARDMSMNWLRANRDQISRLPDLVADIESRIRRFDEKVRAVELGQAPPVAEQIVADDSKRSSNDE